MSLSDMLGEPRYMPGDAVEFLEGGRLATTGEWLPGLITGKARVRSAVEACCAYSYTLEWGGSYYSRCECRIRHQTEMQ